ncbi:putative extracellular SCP domain protein Pry1 [Aspergillus lucknowensis]|uniref:CAP domain-containing protein n=1 Tax=Aspergillus lucknowensis TaxID=176173 RepID=A0ABR4LW33_9EURO
MRLSPRPRSKAAAARCLIALLHLTSLTAVASASETVVVTVTATATTTTTTTATAHPKVPQDPSYTSLTLFKSSILSTTNAYRAAHYASALTWNEALASYAQNWASTCVWEHSHGPYGENLAYGYSNATSAVRAWGEESRMYDFERPTGFTEETGHFTQLVWKATMEMGCAAVDCGLSDLDPGDDGDEDQGGHGILRAQGWYVVCEYVPGGNVVSSGDDGAKYFRMNVQAESEGSEGSAEYMGLSGQVQKSNGAAVLRASRGRTGWWTGMVLCILSSV